MSQNSCTKLLGNVFLSDVFVYKKIKKTGNRVRNYKKNNGSVNIKNRIGMKLSEVTLITNFRVIPVI